MGLGLVVGIVVGGLSGEAESCSEWGQGKDVVGALGVEGVEDELPHEVTKAGVGKGVSWEGEGLWVEEVDIRLQEGHNSAVDGIGLLVGGGCDPWLGGV